MVIKEYSLIYLDHSQYSTLFGLLKRLVLNHSNFNSQLSYFEFKSIWSPNFGANYCKDLID